MKLYTFIRCRQQPAVSHIVSSFEIQAHFLPHLQFIPSAPIPTTLSLCYQSHRRRFFSVYTALDSATSFKIGRGDRGGRCCRRRDRHCTCVRTMSRSSRPCALTFELKARCSVSVLSSPPTQYECPSFPNPTAVVFCFVHCTNSPYLWICSLPIGSATHSFSCSFPFPVSPIRIFLCAIFFSFFFFG